MFPQGEIGWREFLTKNLDAGTLVNNGAPSGTYTIVVQLKVAAYGFLSDFKPFTAHGFDIEQEVLAMIKKSPKWKPGEHNGSKVDALHEQPVTFIIAEE